MMELLPTILATIGLAFATGWAVMFVIFAGLSIGNNYQLSKLQEYILACSFYGLPTINVLSMIPLWIAYTQKQGPEHYWWSALPAPFFIAYILFLVGFDKGWWRIERKRR